MLDPRLWSKGRSSATAGVAKQQLLDEFLRLCDEAGPDQCAFATPGGSAARWDALSAALLAGPFELDDGTTLTYDFLIALTGILLDEPGTAWAGPDGLAVLLDTLADTVLDPPTTAAAGPTTLEPLVERLTAVEQTPADYSNFAEAVYGNRCADTQFPSSFRFPVLRPKARRRIAIRAMGMVGRQRMHRLARIQRPLQGPVEDRHRMPAQPQPLPDPEPDRHRNDWTARRLLTAATRPLSAKAWPSNRSTPYIFRR